jgi:hypothetical protein
MPKVAVSHGFNLRGWDPSASTPTEIYAIASWLGVGYVTLITHMDAALNMLPSDHARKLLKDRNKMPALRKRLIGRECPGNLIVADTQWSGRAIDAQVSDLILLAKGAGLEGACATIIEDSNRGTLLRAIAPGIGRCMHSDSGWSAYLRVSRKDYVGRAKYRFEEEVPNGD